MSGIAGFEIAGFEKLIKTARDHDPSEIESSVRIEVVESK